MAIDWNTVEGYREDMSADEKLALLDNYTPPTDTKEAPEDKPAPKPGYIPKRDFDKLSSDYAALKKQMRSKMTDDEQREAERQAAIEAQEAELKTLRREKALSTHKASFMGLGLDEALATDAATALTDGEVDDLFGALKRYQTGFEKTLRTKILAETPKPPAGENPNGADARKQSASMDMALRIGKDNAQRAQAASDILAQYTGR